MQLYKEEIKHKQRILIGGNRGVDEIYEMVRTVLNHIQKPADFYEIGTSVTFTDAPIVIMKGGEHLINNSALFHDLGIHILVFHELTEELPEGYNTFEELVSQYEKLADSLPKAGSFIFNESNDVAVLLGKKERADVKNIEYSPLKAGQTGSKDIAFLTQAAAAKTLLNRIGVSDDQFFTVIQKL